MDSRLSAAAEWLRGRLPHPPLVGVILGSGLGDFADGVDERVTIPYGDIPGFPASAVVGHSGTLVAGTVRGVPTVVLSGRVHYYEGHPMPAVVFPARVLGLLGCRTVIVTNAAGGIDRSFKSGNLMLIEDHINAFGTNPLVGANDEDLGPRFPDMSDAYRKDLRSLALAVAKRQRIPLRHGVYVGVHGPSYETPAEIRAFRALGRGRGRHVHGARGHRAQPDGRRRPRHLVHHEHGRRRVEAEARPPGGPRDDAAGERRFRPPSDFSRPGARHRAVGSDGRRVSAGRPPRGPRRKRAKKK